MIIKFLKNGTGDPKLAASYLTGEQDHQGYERAEVEILRGDPVVFSALAASVKFQYCYTSAVIAWSPQDHVSEEQLQEVLDLFEEHAFAGLSSNQYHMTAVMHADEDGSKHLHILVPRVELSTGKSLNIAPPGHHHYFDPLRDFLNQKYNWARPDDPARMKTTKPKNHHQLQNAAAMKAELGTSPKKTRVELINKYVEQRIIFGVINNREDLLKCLSELGEVNRSNGNYVSLKTTTGTDRLKGGFYHAEFQFDAYRKNRKGQEGAGSILHESQAGISRTSEELTRSLRRIEEVRRKRFDYNQKYYRTKISEFDGAFEQQSRLSAALGATVSEYSSRETERRRRVNSIQDKNGDAVSGLNEFAPRPNSSIENVPKRESDTVTANPTVRGAASARQQRDQERQHSNDGVAQKNEQSSTESRFEYGKAKNSDPRSNRKDSSTNRKDATTVVQHYVVHWDVRCIKHPFPNQKIHLDIGVTHERNTATNSKKPIDHAATAIDSSIRAKGKDREREEFESATDHRCAEKIYQRTREISEATERLSRTYAQRKLSHEQEVERYEKEISRERQDDQALSRRTQQRDFIQRTQRFFGKIKGEIRNTFRKFISQLASSAPDTKRSTEEFTILYERTGAIGIHRLVNIARRRTKRRRIFESYKKRKQEIELIEQQKNEIFAMNTISAELRKIQKSFPHLNLAASMQNAVEAEAYFHKFRDVTISQEDNDLYLGGYKFYIDQCFHGLKGGVDKLGNVELDAFKKFIKVVDLHLGQIKQKDIDEKSIDYYHDAKQKIAELVQDFSKELTLREAEIINNSENQKPRIDAVFNRGEPESNRLRGQEYDANF